MVDSYTLAPSPVSRRAFIGTAAALAAAAAIPGVIVDAVRAAASGGLAPAYSLATWQALLNTTIRAIGPDGRRHALKVAKVSVLRPTEPGMSGETFLVRFYPSEPIPEALYSLTTTRAGTFPMFLSGSTATHALINTQLPAAI